MSMVQPLAGVAGGMTALDHEQAASQGTSPSFTSHRQSFRFRVTRKLAVLFCAAGLLAATGAGALAGPEADSGYSYGDVGYEDPGSVAEQLNQESGGQAIANYALQFQGYPYVWAGNTAAGFDCSGFTQFVILNTLGVDIGHGVAEQTNYGAWVDWGNWQPGDLVYFAGTYRPGISHTGVYIGDGQFIHAENEGTGVVISSLYSDYYSSHYYGAFRSW